MIKDESRQATIFLDPLARLEREYVQALIRAGSLYNAESRGASFFIVHLLSREFLLLLGTCFQ